MFIFKTWDMVFHVKYNFGYNSKFKNVIFDIIQVLELGPAGFTPGFPNVI